MPEENTIHIGEHDDIRASLLGLQRWESFIFDSCFLLLSEIGSLGDMLEKIGFLVEVGIFQLRDTVDEDLLGGSSEGERVAVPYDNIWIRVNYAVSP